MRASLTGPKWLSHHLPNTCVIIIVSRLTVADVTDCVRFASYRKRFQNPVSVSLSSRESRAIHFAVRGTIYGKLSLEIVRVLRNWSASRNCTMVRNSFFSISTYPVAHDAKLSLLLIRIIYFRWRTERIARTMIFTRVSTTRNTKNKFKFVHCACVTRSRAARIVNIKFK